MPREEQAFAHALAQAIADDVRTHGPTAPVVRVVVRWFEPDRPLSFTAHVLTADEQASVAPEDAWYPLEWPNVDAELARTDRVAARPEVRAAGERLTERYRSDPQIEGKLAEPYEDDLPSPGITETVRALPAALRDAGVPLDEALAVSAAHFEGWGALEVLRSTASRAVLAALEARGLLPDD